MSSDGQCTHSKVDKEESLGHTWECLHRQYGASLTFLSDVVIRIVSHGETTAKKGDDTREMETLCDEVRQVGYGEEHRALFRALLMLILRWEGLS